MFGRLRKIRHQMLAMFCLAAFLGVLILGVFVVTQVRWEMTRQIIHQQEETGRAFQQGLGLKFSEIQRQIEQVAGHPALQREDRVAQQAVVGTLLERNPLLLSGVVYDRTGTVVSATYRNHSPQAAQLVGRNLLRDPKKFGALARTFEKVLATNQSQVSETVSTVRQGRILVWKFPIRRLDDPSAVCGVLSLGLHLDGAALQELLRGFAAPDGFLLLTDRAGNLLARQGDNLPDALAGVTFTPPPTEAPSSAWSELGGRSWLVTGASFPLVEGILVIGTPRARVLGIINRLTFGLVILTLLAMLIAGTLGGVLADRFSAQVLSLVEGIRRVSDGVFSWRVASPTDDELGDACQAFNVMAERLERNRMIEDLWRQRWENRP